MAYESVSLPAPPYSSGIVMPIRPSSASSAVELVREPRLAVELLGDRCDLLQRELANGVADQLMLGLEIEVHAREACRKLDDQPHAVARAALVEGVVRALAPDERWAGDVEMRPRPVARELAQELGREHRAALAELGAVLHVGEVGVDVAAVARVEREAPGEVAARLRGGVDAAQPSSSSFANQPA